MALDFSRTLTLKILRGNYLIYNYIPPKLPIQCDGRRKIFLDFQYLRNITSSLYFLKEAIRRLFHQNQVINQGAKEDTESKKQNVWCREEIGNQDDGCAAGPDSSLRPTMVWTVFLCDLLHPMIQSEKDEEFM